MKTIQYYPKNVYGNDLEYVVNQADASLIQQLTGKKTVTLNVRTTIENLSEGAIKFEKVVQP